MENIFQSGSAHAIAMHYGNVFWRRTSNLLQNLSFEI